MSGTWREVNQRTPCPICGRQGWCRISSDGGTVICRRVDNGNGNHKVDRSGTDYWVYRLNGSGSSTDAEPHFPMDTEPERADPDTLNSVYSAMFEHLDLGTVHREALRRRGLTDEQVDRRSYRTLPTRGRAELARRLADRFGPEACARIPGLYIKVEDSRSWWTLAGPSGTVVPIRDVKARIVALKVRLDDPGDGPKYVYISSTNRGGPGPGSPVHVPLFNGRTEIVRLTEGELKADVATALGGMLTISIPGVSAWRAALPVIQTIGAHTVRLAFDADHGHNQHVARALKRTVQALSDGGAPS